IPDDLSPPELDGFSKRFAALAPARRAWVTRARRSFGADITWGNLVRVAEDGLPDGLARRVVRRDRCYLSGRFGKHPARLARYRALLAALARRRVPGLDPESGWLREMFRTGRPGAGTAALVVLRRARAHAPAESAAALHHLSKAMGGHGPLAEYHAAL